MEEQDAAVTAGLRGRARHALRQRHNWEQLAKFCIVGATGYVVNLLVYVGSFLVAVSNNYLLNRLWTFRHRRGHFGYQGLRFFVVSLLVYGGNLGILTALVELGLGKIVSQAIAIVLVTPANFVGNKLWSFRRQH